MKTQLAIFTNVALILVILFSGKLLAATNDVITICENPVSCSDDKKVQQFVLSKAMGLESDVVLVNEVTSETELYQVRLHDFGGSEFPGMVAITAQQVARITGVGHTNALNLARFLHDPITDLFDSAAVPLDSVSGHPTYALFHFVDAPHQFNLSGISMASLSLRIQTVVNNIFASRSADLLDNMTGSITGTIALTLRKAVETGVTVSLGSKEPVHLLDVFLIANSMEGEAPWGLIVNVFKNGNSHLKNKITGVALIDKGEIIFIIPIAEDGSVDLQKLLGTTILIDRNSNMGSILDWFRQAGFAMYQDPCLTGAKKCVITIVDLKRK